MKIAIVDDTNKDRLYLADSIRKHYATVDVDISIKEFMSGEAFLTEYTEENFDLVFLDIFMQEISGMEVATHIREKSIDTAIIFTTSSTEHAVASYRVQAFDYLLKPFSPDLIHESLSRFDQRNGAAQKSIMIKEGRTIISILVQDIQYVDYYNHYVQIHTRYRTAKSHMKFDDFAKLLVSYPQFISCCRNCIVNMDEVKGLVDKTFVMVNGERIAITRSQYPIARQQYAEYTFSRLAKR